MCSPNVLKTTHEEVKNNPVLSKRPLQAIEAFEDLRSPNVPKTSDSKRQTLTTDHRFLKMVRDRDDMGGKMESMQKYIEVLEENLELHNTLPFHVEIDGKRKFEG